MWTQRDCDTVTCKFQAEGWIDDKLKIAYEDNFQDVTDLQGKMRKLQKHQAFEAEIVANTDRIENIKQVRTWAETLWSVPNIFSVKLR